MVMVTPVAFDGFQSSSYRLNIIHQHGLGHLKLQMLGG